MLAGRLGRASCIPRRMHHGPFRDPDSGEVLDQLNFVFMPGPASVTGEDVLEIHPHGNMLLVGRILRSLLAEPGLRPAEAGEFTRRAFEHGKVDLLQAEAVGQLIHAQTLRALRNAQRTVSGGLSGPLRDLRDALVSLSVRLELDVDFSEEEADPEYASWLPRVADILHSLEKLTRSFEKGRQLGRVPRVVMLGAPNAGKSSLVNALAGEDRLLVSDIPGTTRDYVEVPLHLPGGVVHLVDTAGLGRPLDGLDAMAMDRTRRQLQAADLRVLVQDGSAEHGEGPVQEASAAEASGLEGEFALRVLTRGDLPGFRPRAGFLSVANPSRAGIAELAARLDALAFGEGPDEDVLIASERQYRALEAARERVAAAHANLRDTPAIEIAAFEIQEAAKHLRELLGEISSEEVLRQIFSGFCIGK